MIASTLARALPFAFALAFAAAVPAQAQGQSPTGPGGSSARNQAGESYPNDAKAATDKGSPQVVQDAANSHPAKATKRTAKKGKNIASRAGHRAANATRNTGEAISRHLPGNKGGSTGTGSAADQTAR